MKKYDGFLSLAAGAALLLAGGCSKQEPATPPAEKADRAEAPAPAATPVKEVVKTELAAVASTASNVANAAVSSAKQAVAQPLQAATNQAQATATALATTATNAANAAVSSAQQMLVQKLAVTQSVPALSNQVQTVAGTATNQVQGLIEKAKSLTSNQKYQEALTVVQQLSQIQLTPEQQKLVADLKGQVQSALAKQAGTNALSALGSILGGKK
ncbi:MAG TPA: hypothetical protein VNT26_07880 [Candidatus Sulfotelmatobacter sp.]|nr:hypothetical protein [Candidatus Sulfotelmatobacter sp.]